MVAGSGPEVDSNFSHRDSLVRTLRIVGESFFLTFLKMFRNLILNEIPVLYRMYYRKMKHIVGYVMHLNLTYKL